MDRSQGREDLRQGRLRGSGGEGSQEGTLGNSEKQQRMGPGGGGGGWGWGVSELPEDPRMGWRRRCWVRRAGRDHLGPPFCSRSLASLLPGTEQALQEYLKFPPLAGRASDMLIYLPS